jgi:UPF0755 protein
MRKSLLKLLGQWLLACLLTLGGIWVHMQAMLAHPMDLRGETLAYTVAPGATLQTITQDLHQADILPYPEYLVWEAQKRSVANHIQAGEYEIRPGTTPLAFLEMLVEGRVVRHALMIVEGWTFEEVMAVLRAQPKLNQTLKDLDRKTIMTRLGHPELDPEGIFFPDTYYFSGGASDMEILNRAFTKMQSKLESAWQARDPDLPFDSSYEALTLASIIEKETAQPQERPQVAGVFIRRLKRGMPLQTDPTVIYAMGKEYKGNLRRDDLQIDNLYNTYRYRGLTPTPIAMPSESSILAALHPTGDDALYFVAKGDGSHHFSTTYEEHNHAVNRFQRKSANE